MTFKRNNLDKTNDSIVFDALYNPLSQSSALNCAKRAEGMWAQLISVSGSRSVSGLLPCALSGILLGGTNTLPIAEVIFQRAVENQSNLNWKIIKILIQLHVRNSVPLLCTSTMWKNFHCQEYEITGAQEFLESKNILTAMYRNHLVRKDFQVPSLSNPETGMNGQA